LVEASTFPTYLFFILFCFILFHFISFPDRGLSVSPLSHYWLPNFCLKGKFLLWKETSIDFGFVEL